MKRKVSERSLALLLAVTLLTGLLPIGTGVKSRAAEQITLRNPRFIKTTQEVAPGTSEKKELKNPTMENGVTTWDCIWFGNYWQEDTNGDGKADKNDAKQPIKWRVLLVDGDDVFLLADKNLDCQKYNDTDTGVTWEMCTMRSWLNGYGASANTSGKDYSDDNFLDNAFSGSEQSAIRTTNVVNDDNPEYGTEGGNNTSDKVYLLSIDEATNPAYGFASDDSKYDEGRRANDTEYAKVQGTWANGWWLRSPGGDSRYASTEHHNGYVYWYGYVVFSIHTAVRPALHLNLSSALGCFYAGTVSSDGTVTAPETPRPNLTTTPTNQPGSTGGTAAAGPNTSVNPGVSPGAN